MSTHATRLETDPARARQPVPCQLVVLEGPDVGRAVRLDGPLTVGTDPACEFVLTDAHCSRRHLHVVPAGQGFLLRDLGSTNGTLFEGSRVRELTVPAGATVRVGRTFLRILALPERLAVRPSKRTSFGALVGESLCMREVFAVLELGAASDVTVLLEGETGTGKELAARALHDESARAKGPFVAVDCSSLPEGLIDSELFGHVRGAFTGATQTRTGALARARGGTVFLDEIDSMPLAVQTRLLRVLEQRAVRPVGADREVPLDVRVVTASRRELFLCTTDGSFRVDLYYRLAVLRLVLPPLRERLEDLGLLVDTLLARRGSPLRSEPEALGALTASHWPGNVRELRNAVDRALALAPTASTFAELPLRSEADALEHAPVALRTDLAWTEARAQWLAQFERRYLASLMAATDDNLSAAARKSGLDRKHLRALLRRHGLRAPEG